MKFLCRLNYCVCGHSLSEEFLAATIGGGQCTASWARQTRQCEELGPLPKRLSRSVTVCAVDRLVLQWLPQWLAVKGLEDLRRALPV